MYTDSEGIILKQIKIAGGRRMVVLFSKKYGKISAGTSVSERGKNKSALALRPFTLGRYELFKNKENFNINGAETIESFYSIGENVDKYMVASYALELTELMLADEQPAPALFNLITEYLQLLQHRKNAFDTLLVAFMLKALYLAGEGPVLKSCVKCGASLGPAAFSVRDGGFVCSRCLEDSSSLNPLLFVLPDDIISAMQYIESHSLRSLENLALPKDSENMLRKIMRQYYSYHLGIDNLKSEGLKI